MAKTPREPKPPLPVGVPLRDGGCSAILGIPVVIAGILLLGKVVKKVKK
jgi:hypothetical protein